MKDKNRLIEIHEELRSIRDKMRGNQSKINEIRNEITLLGEKRQEYQDANYELRQKKDLLRKELRTYEQDLIDVYGLELTDHSIVRFYMRVLGVEKDEFYMKVLLDTKFYQKFKKGGCKDGDYRYGKHLVAVVRENKLITLRPYDKDEKLIVDGK